MKSEKVIILGHTGFIGGCFYENFRKFPQYEVYGLSSAQIDLSSSESVLKLHEFVGRDMTVIMAASAMVKDKTPFAFTKEIAMFVNLAEVFSKCAVKHLIYISSLAIYGRWSDSIITEFSRPKPDDFYSISKLFGELILGKVCADHSIPLTILRPAIVYGAGDFRTPLFRFINSVRTGRIIEMHGNDSTRLFWVHKFDLWRIVHSVIDNVGSGHFNDYNIVSDDDGISLIGLAEIVFKVCKVRTGIKFVPSVQVSPSLKFDTSKFNVDFPGFGFIKLEDGINDYNSFYLPP